MFPWMSVTATADTVVMLPAAAFCLLLLYGIKAFRLAFWWLVLFSSGLIVVAATKIAFLGWGMGISSLDFTGFSGHAMRVTAVAPVLLYLLFLRFSATLRLSVAFIGLAFGVLIGISRVMVEAHSVSEAVGGCVVGATISITFLFMMRPLKRTRLPSDYAPMFLVVLVPFLALPPAPTEQWLEHIALTLSGHEKAFQRIKVKADESIPWWEVFAKQPERS